MNTTNHLIFLLQNNDVEALTKFFMQTDWKNDIDFKDIFDFCLKHINPNTQNMLGFIYNHGHGVDQDYQKAMYYFQLVADQGYAIAQTNLGGLYNHGHGVEQDYQKAMYYFQLAADQGFAFAQNNLGWFYSHGHGVEQDYQKAIHYYQLAVDQGFALAQNNLKNILHDNGAHDFILKALTELKETLSELTETTEELKLKNDVINILECQPGGLTYLEAKEHYMSLVNK